MEAMNNEEAQYEDAEVDEDAGLEFFGHIKNGLKLAGSKFVHGVTKPFRYGKGLLTSNFPSGGPSMERCKSKFLGFFSASCRQYGPGDWHAIHGDS